MRSSTYSRYWRRWTLPKSESRRDGSFGAELGKRLIDFRVATSGAAGGEKMVIRILDAAGALMKLERLGMSKRLMRQVDGIATQPYGMLLCTGPTGGGQEYDPLRLFAGD